MAQALPSFDVPLTTYQAGVDVVRELKNIAKEGDGYMITFSYEPDWVPTPAPPQPVLVFTTNVEVSEDNGKTWIQHSGPFRFSSDPPRPGQTYKGMAASWQIEPGDRKIKGDFKFTLSPSRRFSTAIHAEVYLGSPVWP